VRWGKTTLDVKRIKMLGRLGPLRVAERSQGLVLRGESQVLRLTFPE